MGNSKNKLLTDFSGHIEKTIVVKQYSDGRTIITAYPDMSKIKPSEGQKEQRSLFKDAVSYAKNILDSPLEKNEAESRLSKRSGSLYHALLKEYIAQNSKNQSN